MTALTIQDVSRHSGLSEPTPRYHEEVGLIGPTARDPNRGNRRYREEEVGTLHALACLRAPWDARDRAGTGAEAEANLQVHKLLPRQEELVLG